MEGIVVRCIGFVIGCFVIFLLFCDLCYFCGLVGCWWILLRNEYLVILNLIKVIIYMYICSFLFYVIL